MEFWGVEVKAGQSLKVEPDEDQVIHISQASIGESKKGKGADSVPLYVKIGDQKLVLGTLSSEKIPQISFDLVFEKEFELSHNWTGGSVYFMGYKSEVGDEGEDYSDFGSDEDIQMQLGANGSIEAVPAAAIKAKAAKKSDLTEEDDSDSEDDSDGSDDDDDEVMSDDSDEVGDDSEEDEETPKKPEVSKKRPNEAAAKKTPDNKKAKLATPSKTDGKKEPHTATPHPKKQGKASAGNKTQSPKSGGSLSCKSCSKTFTSDVGLQSHAKAKHSGGK